MADTQQSPKPALQRMAEDDRITSANCRKKLRELIDTDVKLSKLNLGQAAAYKVVFHYLKQQGMEKETSQSGIEQVINYLEKNLKTAPTLF